MASFSVTLYLLAHDCGAPVACQQSLAVPPYALHGPCPFTFHDHAGHGSGNGVAVGTVVVAAVVAVAVVVAVVVVIVVGGTVDLHVLPAHPASHSHILSSPFGNVQRPLPQSASLHGPVKHRRARAGAAVSGAAFNVQRSTFIATSTKRKGGGGVVVVVCVCVCVGGWFTVKIFDGLRIAASVFAFAKHAGLFCIATF